MNFSTLLLTLLMNGAITVACSGGRAKGEPLGSPESPSEWTLQIFCPDPNAGIGGMIYAYAIQAVRSHSNDEKDKKGRYLRRESFSGTCARSFYVGDVKKEDIHAKFEDGVLHVELPAPQQTKALPENPNLIEIE